MRLLGLKRGPAGNPSAGLTECTRSPRCRTNILCYYRVEGEETLQTTGELGIAFVAYSPLGRGLLTAKAREPATLAETDTRRRHPRFAWRQPHVQSRSGTPHRGDCAAQRLYTRPAGAGVAACAGSEPHPDPGNQAEGTLARKFGRARRGAQRLGRGRDFASHSGSVPPPAPVIPSRKWPAFFCSAAPRPSTPGKLLILRSPPTWAGVSKDGGESCRASILRDARLRRAPQDEVMPFWNANYSGITREYLRLRGTAGAPTIKGSLVLVLARPHWRGSLASRSGSVA